MRPNVSGHSTATAQTQLGRGSRPTKHHPKMPRHKNTRGHQKRGEDPKLKGGEGPFRKPKKEGKRPQLKKDAGKHTKTMDSPRPNARASMIRVEQPHPRERPHTRKGDGTRVRKKERKREKNRISHRISQRISHRISHDHSYPESERLERSAPPGQKLADALALPRA